MKNKAPLWTLRALAVLITLSTFTWVIHSETEKQKNTTHSTSTNTAPASTNLIMERRFIPATKSAPLRMPTDQQQPSPRPSPKSPAQTNAPALTPPQSKSPAHFYGTKSMVMEPPMLSPATSVPGNSNQTLEILKPSK
ncbi:MAG: hypothetical protein SFY92_07935 [Verrucomicrobiae bacterium]|nr:hypothetical protein [Verrucomicrobiae bacterium]